MKAALISRTLLASLRQFRRRSLFFVFFAVAFFLTGTINVLFRSLEGNREVYFAQRYTGYYTLVKSEYAEFQTKNPPRSEYLFDPSDVRKVLDELSIRYSVRLRAQAMLYVDDPSSMELKNPCPVLLVGADPRAEFSILESLDIEGRIPVAGSYEALFLPAGSVSGWKNGGYVIQKMSSFGFPFEDKIEIVGRASTQGANDFIYGSILWLEREVAAELWGLEGDRASDIMLGPTNFFQRAMLSARIGKSYRLIRYEDSDSIAQAIALVCESLNLLLFLFVAGVLVSAMANSVTISVMNRSSEVGVRRIFGYGDGTIIAMFCFEYGLIALTAWFAGSILSAGFCLLVNGLEIQAININLEIAFSGQGLELRPSLSDYLRTFALLTSILFGIVAFQVSRFLREHKLLAITR